MEFHNGARTGMLAFLNGFALGFSLILVIGAQNAFVLRQGLRREHVFAVCMTCALSDAMLIALGVTSLGRVAQALPWIAPVMRYGGAGFLIFYGVLNARAAWRGGERLKPGQNGRGSLRSALLTSLALTWLNPHVYLDTVVLLGSVSAQYDPAIWFGIGAASASFAFFFSLGYGARLLAHLFARPAAWRVLDSVVALTMWGIAALLMLD